MSRPIRVLWLDTSLAFTAIAVAVAIVLPQAQHGIDKAAFSEVMLQSRVGQIELSERLAVNGPMGLAAAPGANEPVVELKGRFELEAQLSGDNYLLFGRHQRSGALFNMAFAPSFIQDEPAGSVNWLCGRYGAAAGWSGPSAGPGTDLAAGDTPFVCRARNSAPPVTNPNQP